MRTQKWFPVIIMIFATWLLSCGPKNGNKYHNKIGQSNDKDQITLTIKNMIITDDSIYNDNFIYGVLSIKPSNDSTYIQLSKLDVTDTTLIYPDEFPWKDLPVLNQKKVIGVDYIHDAQLIVCGSHTEEVNWFKIQPGKNNTFYFCGSASHPKQNRDTLYFKIPFKIKNKEVSKIFKFFKGIISS